MPFEESVFKGTQYLQTKFDYYNLKSEYHV